MACLKARASHAAAPTSPNRCSPARLARLQDFLVVLAFMVSFFYQSGNLLAIIVAETRVSGRSNSWAMRRSGRCCLGLLTKPSQFLACLLQQLARGGCLRVLHHCQQHASGGFGVGLGVVVVEIVADVRRQCGKLMVFQFWPDTAGELTGANIIKIRSG